MTAGIKTVVINNLERAKSNDINRLQQFLTTAQAELFRSLVNVDRSNVDFASGSVTETLVTTDPLTCEVYSGLLVRPSNGTNTFTIDSGLIGMVDPNTSPSPDDSVYKLVQDPGLVAGTLTIGDNFSGATRIDVIECKRNSALVVETDTRDVFNPVTGLFAPTPVTKVTADSLTYRVRAGTPNLGYPGPANGWCALAVVSVPTGSTSCDTCTFWDVRPLVSSRTVTPYRAGKVFPAHRNLVQIDTVSVPGHQLLAGYVETSVSGGLCKVGGSLSRGTPGVDGPVDLNDAANQVGSMPGTGAVFVYLMTPFGLPRWARYTDASAGARVPRNPDGIPVVTATPPNLFGGPNVPIQLPASTGLTGALPLTTQEGVCICVTQHASGAFAPIISDGRMQWSDQLAHDIGGLTSSGDMTWQFKPYGASGSADVHYPANAKSIRIRFGYLMQGTQSDTFTIAQPIIMLQDPTLTNTYWQAKGELQQWNSANYPAGSIPRFWYITEMEIPIGLSPIANGFCLNINPNVTSTGAGYEDSSQLLTMLGWGY